MIKKKLNKHYNLIHYVLGMILILLVLTINFTKVQSLVRKEKRKSLMKEKEESRVKVGKVGTW